jgi:hypothetical protein
VGVKSYVCVYNCIYKGKAGLSMQACSTGPTMDVTREPFLGVFLYKRGSNDSGLSTVTSPFKRQARSSGQIMFGRFRGPFSTACI